MTIDLAELRGYISDMYADVALLPRGDFHFPLGRELLERLGYEPANLDQIPEAAVESCVAVGYFFDLAPLEDGEDVLDLGCGAGTDVFYAALSMHGGSVTGLDMTEAMVEKSQKSAEALGLDNVRFVQGHIESLPFEDASFDVVLSNGVPNLSPQKERLLSEIHRVLRPGGRVMIADIVTGVHLPQSIRDNCELWAECIGGAEEEQSYLGLFGRAGLRVDTVRPNERYSFTRGSTLSAAEKFRVRSISFVAYKE